MASVDPYAAPLSSSSVGGMYLLRCVGSVPSGEGSSVLGFRRNIHIRTITASMRSAPTDIPTPMPALAPVDSPLLDKLVSWAVDVGVDVAVAVAVAIGSRIPVLVVVWNELVVVTVIRSEARQRIETPLALIPSAVVVKLETTPPLV